VEDQASSGDILVSSSAADEQSFESEHGGLFTLHWTAGLRGAADANTDGQVSLSEVYSYAYAQTLRSTLGASAGPQHATFRYALEGHRDPVLTRLAGGGLLTLRPESAGAYVLFDGSERSVVAELPARSDEPRRIALAPGEYVVRLRTTRSLRVARVILARDDDRVLPEHQMQEVPLLRLARKGSIGDRFVVAGVGAHASGLGPSGELWGSVGLEWEGERWVPGLELAVAAGTQEHRGLATKDLLVQASVQRLYSVRLGTAALRAGPVAGVAYVRQESEGYAGRESLGLSLGVRLRGDAQITPAVGAYVLAEARGLGVQLETRSRTWLGIEPMYVVAAGMRAAF
jgi:hypothetical protein